MKNPPPPPAALRRKGLLRIETNLQPGQRLVLPENALGEAFGRALFEKIMAKQAEEWRKSPEENA